MEQKSVLEEAEMKVWRLEQGEAELKERLKMAAQHYRRLQQQMKGSEEYRSRSRSTWNSVEEVGKLEKQLQEMRGNSMNSSRGEVSSLASLASESSNRQLDSLNIRAAVKAGEESFVGMSSPETTPSQMTEVEKEARELSLLEKWSSQESGSLHQKDTKPTSPVSTPSPMIPAPKSKSPEVSPQSTLKSYFRPLTPVHPTMFHPL